MPLAGYTAALAIPLSNTVGVNAVTGVQMQVELTGANFPALFAACLYTGYDVRFSSDEPGASLLNFFREIYDSTGKYASFWVQLPTLAAGASTTIYMQYGNSGASDVSSYDNTFAKLVNAASVLAGWHFDDGSGTSAADFSSNSRTLALTATPTWTGTDGGAFGPTSKVFSTGAFITFNGTTQFGSATGLLDTMPSAITIGGWWKPTANMGPGYAANASNPRIASKNMAVNNTIDWYIGTTGQMTLTVQIGATINTIGSQRTVWAAGVWYFIEATVGPGGQVLRVNGVDEDFQPNSTLPSSGSATPFRLGAFYDGAQGFCGGSFDEWAVLNYQRTEAESRAVYRRRKYVAGGRLSDRFTRLAGNPMAVPTYTVGSGLRTHILEPNVVLDGSTYHMIATGINTTQSTGPWLFHYTATSLDGPWTIQNSGVKVIGGGNGGEAGLAMGSCTCWDPINSRWNIYYSTGYATDAILKMVSTTDWSTFTARGTCITLGQQRWFLNTSNTQVVYDTAANHFKMIFEAEVANASAGQGNYFCGYAESNDGLAWRLHANNPLSSLQFNNGTYGGPKLILVGTTYHLLYHVSIEFSQGGSNFYHTNLAHASIPQSMLNLSANPNGWQHDDSVFFTKWGYSFVSGTTGEADQIGDVECVYDGVSKVYLYFDVNLNSGFSGQNANIQAANWSGSLAQLFTDTPTVTLPSVSVGATLLRRPVARRGRG